MLRRFFEWLFKRELQATSEIDLNTKCPRCEQRAFYQYSLDDETIYNCTHCRYTFGKMFRLTPTSEVAERA